MKEVIENKLYREIFKNDWCPLFGRIPLIVTPPNSPISQCIEIIIAARHLWGQNESIDPYMGKPLSSWPEPQDVPLYPKKRLRTARAIYREAGFILFNSQYSSVEPWDPNHYYEKEDGTYELKIGIGQVREDVLKQQTYLIIGVEEKVGSDFIFAMIAISYAYWALSEIFIGGQSGDNPEVRDKISTAENLMKRVIQIDLSKTRKELETKKNYPRKGHKEAMLTIREKKKVLEAVLFELYKGLISERPDLRNKNSSASIILERRMSKHPIIITEGYKGYTSNTIRLKIPDFKENT